MSAQGNGDTTPVREGFAIDGEALTPVARAA